MGERLHWAPKDPHELESWSEGVRLIEALHAFRYPSPRMHSVLRIRVYAFLQSAVGIDHYRL